MAKAKLTSKGQVTIPKEIRDYLRISENSTLKFEIDDMENESRSVILTKEVVKEKCPVCKGDGSIQNGTFACFVCAETGEVDVGTPILLYIYQLPLRKYEVAISTIQHKKRSDGQIYFLQIPEIEINSDKYPKELLDHTHDYLYMRLIKEYAPKSINNSSLFMLPADIVLEEIIHKLKTDDAKKTVTRWFRP